LAHLSVVSVRDTATDENGVVVNPQPTLSLWDVPPVAHTSRILADASDRIAWLRARSTGVTATDVARLSSAKALQAVALDKLLGTGFGGNAFTDHGKAREPEIAPSSALFHADGEKRHLATPDGVGLVDGALVLAEIKTTSSVWRSIPRSYLRQVWWQQYVVGAERTLLVWEQHADFVPVDAEPTCRWIERDDNEIHMLVGLANRLLELMRR